MWIFIYDILVSPIEVRTDTSIIVVFIHIIPLEEGILLYILEAYVIKSTTPFATWDAPNRAQWTKFDRK